MVPFDLQAFGQYGHGQKASTAKSRDYKDNTDLVVAFQSSQSGERISDKIGTLCSNYGSRSRMGVVYGSQDPIVSDKAHCVQTNSGLENVLYEADPPKAFAQNSRNELRYEGGDGQKTGCLTASSSAKPGQGHPTILQNQSIRRLTPKEGERLQGFPDDHTMIPYKGKPAVDTPRYKAIGNSMAVPVIQWIGRRIEQEVSLV